ncbi:excisionase family DNA-binding protein [Mycolicibacterium goodii]|uniref:helix-turn-helix transcriptional regulator n=1 Tax=Mycolicibacterium goodii TaxID=134601 RepID=UPI001BDC44E8|nr:helix-turn-helix domain-containing protein [Mycolicibacterium goodii]MBU8810702.1 excisionase family DNA-binding protein [Mycolicibacterium goodii]
MHRDITPQHTYITPVEAAAVLGVTRRTVANMVNDGRLPAYRLGPRLTRLRLDEVKAALQPVASNA